MSYNKTIDASIFGYYEDWSTLERDVHFCFVSVNITVLIFVYYQDWSTLESDVHFCFVSVNITVLMLTNPDVYFKIIY